MHFLVGDCRELQLNPCITGRWTLFFFGGYVDKVQLALNSLELTLMSYSHTMLPWLGEMWEVEVTSWDLGTLYWGVKVSYMYNQMPLLERIKSNEINLV